MSAYYVLLHFWVRLFGEGEVAIRSLSVVFAVLAVPATFLVGQRLFGRFAGLTAALLLAVNSFFIQFAQEARSYSLVLLLVTLSSYFFVVELEQPSLASRVGYVATSALAFYAHYFAAYVLLAQFVTLVAFRRRAALTRQWLAAGAAIVILCTPELIAAERAGSDPIAWIGRPTLHNLLATAVDLAGGSRTLLVLLASAGCYAAGLALRKRTRWRYGYVIAWLLVPVLLSFVLSFAQPMFLSRYVIVSLPALMLLGAAGLAEVPGR
jgi:mannosyltransferase